MPQQFFALTTPQYDPGNTAFVLICAAMVLFMTPGLALFYAGMIRSKNALAMMMQNFVAIAVGTVAWFVAGYSLAFGPDGLGRITGNLHFAGFAHPDDAPAGIQLTVPPLAFAMFQMMFAIITLALITGSVAERTRFGGFVVFGVIWSLFVYAPIAHWFFAPGGFMAHLGALDFAGGNAVEMNSGASGLALALLIGARRGWPREVSVQPHNLPLTITGAGILWFGWYGFNAGSALIGGQLAANAFVSTHMSSVGGLIGWLVIERLRSGRPTTLGAISGAVAGLVAITPANGYVGPFAGLLIGLAAGIAAAFLVEVKFKLRYDDSLDVVAVHYAGGLIGVLSIGLFASKGINPGIGNQGLFYGGGLKLLGIQALSVLVTTGFAFCATYAIGWLVSKVTPLRATSEQEVEGLDTALHQETAYDLGSGRPMGRVS